MGLFSKRKQSVYDPALASTVRPFGTPREGARCDRCKNPAVKAVNLPGTFTGNLCAACIRTELPYPYDDPALYDEAEKLFNEGKRYYTGDGTVQDCVKALALYVRAAELGHAEAQYHVGLCHKSGAYGLEHSWASAALWLEKSAVHGNIDAAYEYGNLCYKGVFGVPSYESALKWLAVAAEAGHAGAQNEYGKCYAEGKAVPRNYKKAVFWWRQSAAQGNAYAQESLDKLLGKKY